MGQRRQTVIKKSGMSDDGAEAEAVGVAKSFWYTQHRDTVMSRFLVNSLATLEKASGEGDTQLTSGGKAGVGWVKGVCSWQREQHVKNS